MQLPDGWDERISSSRGVPYYYNRVTGETQWERPTAAASGDRVAKVHAYHLLVKHCKSRRPSSWREAVITRSSEEALVILKEYEEKIKGSSDPFETFRDLARGFSDCSSAKADGDLGGFGRGQMQKPFEDAVFALQPGQLSSPISTDSGWHLIYRVK